MWRDRPYHEGVFPISPCLVDPDADDVLQEAPKVDLAKDNPDGSGQGGRRGKDPVRRSADVVPAKGKRSRERQVSTMMRGMMRGMRSSDACFAYPPLAARFPMLITTFFWLLWRSLTADQISSEPTTEPW